ncbi:hypothetical protein SmJEL517_g05056 [Synchytrium microbalum]|uniref:NodB homology domain-containing protein n=1 Tax=Synchytrium microbalum TaxID=1806994 RepID=A0A507BR49_9FUNG|nr:uncharacterized protein SmJEL517_g05056 [Synchytrium microbalum]TPX31637.1 hypothetical protein SmJEL517_g05056 [Synchytrium microbalum]
MIGKAMISFLSLAKAVSALWNNSTASPNAWNYPALDVVVSADPTITAMYNISSISTKVSPSPQTALYSSPGVVTNGPNGTRMMAALTFDDGPSLGNSEILYNWLDAHPDVKVTLFIVGSRVFEAPALLQRAHNAGMEICAHTWSYDVIGMRPICARPPFGDMDARSEQVLKAAGYSKLYIWSQDSTDSDAGASSATTLSTMQEFLDQQVAGTLNGEQGGIFLQHDLLPVESSGDTPVLDYALSKGLKIVPASVLAGTGIQYKVNGTIINMTPSAVAVNETTVMPSAAVAAQAPLASPSSKFTPSQPFGATGSLTGVASSGFRIKELGVSFMVLLFAVLLL